MEKELTIEEFTLIRKESIKEKIRMLLNNGHYKENSSRIIDDIENSGNIIISDLDETGVKSLKKLLEDRNKTVEICYFSNYLCPSCNKNKISTPLTKDLNKPFCSLNCLKKFSGIYITDLLDKFIKEMGIEHRPLDFKNPDNNFKYLK